MSLKNQIEALLFSSGRAMSIEELKQLCNSEEADVLNALKLLKEEYANRDTSLMVIDEGNNWKLAVKEDYAPLVSKIIVETELTKSVMETLAVIAFKYPIKQSDLIKIRTNKAYDHLKQLEEAGYITRQKYGRTKLIKLTQKFFDYFSLTEDRLKDQFKNFESIAKAIEAKENEIKRIKEEQKRKSKNSVASEMPKMQEQDVVSN